MAENHKQPSTAKEFYEVYSDYNKSLRTWFLSLGLGGPAFLLSNDEVKKAVTETGCIGAVLTLFLVGIFFQILIVLMNKSSAWVNYAVLEGSLKAKIPAWIQKLSDKLSENYILDFLADLATGISFFLAAAFILYSA